MWGLLLCALACAAGAVSAPRVAWAQDDAVRQIDGRVQSEEGRGIAGTVVTLEPLRLVEYTDQDGGFVFRDVPPGTYDVVFQLGELEARVSGVTIGPAGTITVDRILPRDFRLSMATVVHAASRVQEPRLDTPAAISVIGERTIALEGGAGQLPTLLQHAAGAEYLQSGVYNIEFNTRGFNGTLTRRVQVLLDGVDLAAPEAKNQEWIAVGFVASELESVELVRGPAASLYGANNINGVVAMTTKSPRGSPGGRARVTTGELDTFMADARWAGELGREWWGRGLMNYTRSGTFAQSRTGEGEYPGLPREVGPALNLTEVLSADGRLDRYLPGGRQLILQSAFSRSEGGTYLTQAGRLSILDSKRSWTRARLNAARWTAQAYIGSRHGDHSALYAPIRFPTSSLVFKGEAQGTLHFAGGRGRAILGGAYLQEHADSADSTGAQTLYQRAVTTRAPSAYAQIDVSLGPVVKAVGGLRWDESTLHPSQVSPRAALVVRPAEGHSLHVGFNRGFQVGNYTEIFLNVPLAPPLDLSAIEAALGPALGGVTLGFRSVPIFAIGNVDLGVESVNSLEAGYVAAVGSRARFSADVYWNRMRNFISDLLPGINPAYPSYRAPDALAAPVRAVVEQVVRGLLPGLTNLPDGRPQIVYSNGNVGRVSSRGLELEGTVRPAPQVAIDASYTWFDFTIEESLPGLEPKANAPAHRAALGLTWDRAPLAASVRHRWVDRFPWASGVFIGDVPAYHVTDVHASLALNARWSIGANVSNLFDRRHFEMFGGDILRRRALVHLATAW